MIANALLLAFSLFMAFCLVLMDRLKLLVPYRQAIFHEYGWAIALYAVLLFGNLFAALFLMARRFFLKHTGQKLLYADRQLRIGEDDLAVHIRERSEE
jgi:hypothetical protein